MKRFFLLTIILAAGAVAGRVVAQDAASASKRAISSMCFLKVSAIKEQT